MPSRILKESILDSPTLARLDDFDQDQFPRLLLLVDDWGCFNADPDVVKGRAYSKRPKVTPKTIEKLLRSYYDAGMLFMWYEGERLYGYWVGWDTHNYCNASAVEDDGKQSKHRRKTPEPPLELVEQYVATHKNKLEQDRTKAFIPIPIPIPIPKEINKSEKRGFGEHGNVRLTDSEYQKLVGKFGQAGADDRIKGADLYFGSKGNAGEWKSHYLAILNWERMKEQKAAGNGTKNVKEVIQPTAKPTAHVVGTKHKCNMCDKPHEFICDDDDCPYRSGEYMPCEAAMATHRPAAVGASP